MSLTIESIPSYPSPVSQENQVRFQIGDSGYTLYHVNPTGLPQTATGGSDEEVRGSVGIGHEIRYPTTLSPTHIARSPAPGQPLRYRIIYDQTPCQPQHNQCMHCQCPCHQPQHYQSQYYQFQTQTQQPSSPAATQPTRNTESEPISHAPISNDYPKPEILGPADPNMHHNAQYSLEQQYLPASPVALGMRDHYGGDLYSTSPVTDGSEYLTSHGHPVEQYPYNLLSPPGFPVFAFNLLGHWAPCTTHQPAAVPQQGPR